MGALGTPLLSELKTPLPAQGYADLLAQLQDAITGQLAQPASSSREPTTAA